MFTIFGSARLKPEDPYYQMAVDIARKITEIGFGVITGGGPGILEAGEQRSERERRQRKIHWIKYKLPFEQNFNPFIDKPYSINFDYFS